VRGGKRERCVGPITISGPQGGRKGGGNGKGQGHAVACKKKGNLTPKSMTSTRGAKIITPQLIAAREEKQKKKTKKLRGRSNPPDKKAWHEVAGRYQVAKLPGPLVVKEKPILGQASVPIVKKLRSSTSSKKKKSSFAPRK